MKKENFKKGQVMHDPKKLKNEKKENPSQDSDDASDDEFDETLKQGSRNKVNPNMRDNSRDD